MPGWPWLSLLSLCYALRQALYKEVLQCNAQLIEYSSSSPEDIQPYAKIVSLLPVFKLLSALKATIRRVMPIPSIALDISPSSHSR